MMKTLFKAALAASVATGLFASPAFAAPADTETFTAKATIVKPVTMTNGTDLDFGTTTMNPTLTSATVTVGDADGSAAVCSNITMLTCSGGAPAGFTLTGGVAGQTVEISFDTPPTQLDHVSIVGASVPFSLDAVEDVVLDSAGAGDFNIGGTITVSASTADGDYEADVNVVANYL